MGHVQDRWRDPARKGKGRRWQARVRGDDGREHSESFDRKIDAQQWVTRMEAARSMGQFIEPRAGDTKFGDYAWDWWRRGSGRATSQRTREGLLRLHLIPEFGEYPLRAIRPSMVEAFTAKLRARGYKATTVRGIIRLLSAVMNAAVRDRMIHESPVSQLPTAPKRHVQPPTIAEVTTLLAMTPDWAVPFITTLAGTGMRAGEAIGLTADRVDWARRTIRVDRQIIYDGSFTPPKSASSVRTIPMPNFVAAVLPTHLEPGDLVFQRDGKALSRNDLRHKVTDRWAADGHRVTLHGLRHHYASVLIAAGESPVVVAARLGHASPSLTLAVYSHLWPDDDAKTRSILDAGWAASGPQHMSPDIAAVQGM